jgi:hypothetical protein
MKKILLATAITTVLASASYAEDANTDSPEPAAVAPKDFSEAPLPGGLKEFDGAHPDGKDPEEQSRSSYVHSSTRSNGYCSWHVHVDKVYKDGHTDWFEYNTRIPCTKRPPTPNGTLPAAADDQPYLTPQMECPPPENIPWGPDVVSVSMDEDCDIHIHYKDGTQKLYRDGELVMVLPPAIALPKTVDKKDSKPSEQPRISLPPQTAAPPPAKPADPPKAARQEPTRLERFKAWCRDVFECQTEEELKKAHDEALQKYKEEHKTDAPKDLKTSFAPVHPTSPMNADSDRDAGRVQENALASSLRATHSTTRPLTAKLGERNESDLHAVGKPTGRVAELRTHSLSGMTKVGFADGMKGGFGGLTAHGFGRLGSAGLGGLRVGGFGI